MEKVRVKTPEQAPVVIDLTSSKPTVKKGVWRCMYGICDRICKEGEPSYLASSSPQSQKYCGFNHRAWRAFGELTEEEYFKMVEKHGWVRWDPEGGEK